MSAAFGRPRRLSTLLALLFASYLLAHAIAQCGAVSLSDHGASVHIASTPAAESHSGHAHTDEEPHLPHEMHSVAAMPRSDNVLRVSGPAVVAAMLTLAVLAAWAMTPRAPRAPPTLPIRARSGRAILGTLCIDRC